MNNSSRYAKNNINKLINHKPWTKSACLYLSWKTSSNCDRQFTDYINARVKHDTKTVMAGWRLKLTALFLSPAECGGARFPDQGIVTLRTQNVNKMAWVGGGHWSNDGKHERHWEDKKLTLKKRVRHIL